MASRVLTDRNEIQQWAEERGAKPACVSRTGQGDIGMIRLEFPDAPNANDSNLEEISWDDFFGKFDESRLALLVQDELAEGGQSNFNKLVGRETAEAAERGEKTSRHGNRSGAKTRTQTKTKTAAKKSGRGAAAPAKKTSVKKTAAKKTMAKKATTKKYSAKKASGGTAGKSAKKASSKFAALRGTRASTERAASTPKSSTSTRGTGRTSARSAPAARGTASAKRSGGTSAKGRGRS